MFFWMLIGGKTENDMITLSLTDGEAFAILASLLCRKQTDVWAVNNQLKSMINSIWSVLPEFMKKDCMVNPGFKAQLDYWDIELAVPIS